MDVSELLEESPQIWAVNNWEEYKAQAFQLIEGEHSDELLCELTSIFINSATWERDIRRNALEDIYKNGFVNKSNDEQKEAVESAQNKEKKLIDEAIGEMSTKVEGNINIVPEQMGATSPYTNTLRPTIRKTRDERLFGKYMVNTLASSSFNYSITMHGENVKFYRTEQSENRETEITYEIRGFSDRCETLVDFIVNFIAKSNDGRLLRQGANENYLIRYDDFINAIEGFVTDIKVERSVRFTGQELRKHFNGLRFTDKDIVEALNELENTKIVLQAVKIWYDSAQKRYKKITHTDRIIYSTTIRETGKLAPRTKDSQFEFTLRIGTGWSMIFHNDIINRRFGCFPQKFYRASKETRQLGRYLSCFRNSIMTINDMSKILGYEGTSNLSMRKKHIEKHLDELKDFKIIKTWRRYKKNGRECRGDKTSWEIQRI
jgi:hypothetical protein